METTEERRLGLLHQIIPPRLDDAGLEDCALPPDSIKEAFLKAATAVKSRAASFLNSDEDEEDCVKDPWPSAKDRTDVVVGLSPEAEPPGSCIAEKGGGRLEAGDDVVVGDAEEKTDEVVGGEEKGGMGEKDCVEGLQGLEIGEKRKDDGDDEEEEKKPILVEGFF
ncbi:hypothetical protein UlMin_016842 [Ulmus minor]